MERAEWQAKVEKYFALLHPDFDTLSDEQQWDLLGDKHFIIENTDAIHEAFSEFSNSDSPRYMGKATEQERMQKAMWHAKVEKYFALLHPDFDTLSDEQQWDLLGDKHFIIENTDAIHEAFSEFSNSDSPRYMGKATEQERMQKAMWHAKVEKYFALLHPEFDTLSDEQQWDLLDDKRFIIRNTDAVHEAFSEFSNSDSPRYMESASEQERMQKAIEEIKVKERNSKKITPTVAVKSALKGTTAIKSAEANGVEQSELNPEITKEGEEIDD